jgi:hypothetical protein
MKRDVLAPRAGPAKRDAADQFGEPPAQPEVTVEPVCDEPTWEVRRPGKGGRRIDGRTRSILTMAAVAAVVVNAGAAWAYWKLTAPTIGGEKTGAVIELALRGRSDLNRPLSRGGVGNLTVTVTNDNTFPIRISSVAPGATNIVADDEHRDGGCLDATGVTMTRAAFAVSWEVARNTVGAFTIPAGLRMAKDANPACEGATFTVPIQVSGVSVAS